jgi:hypothetical protein
LQDGKRREQGGKDRIESIGRIRLPSVVQRAAERCGRTKRRGWEDCHLQYAHTFPLLAKQAADQARCAAECFDFQRFRELEAVALREARSAVGPAKSSSSCS